MLFGLLFIVCKNCLCRGLVFVLLDIKIDVLVVLFWVMVNGSVLLNVFWFVFRVSV